MQIITLSSGSAGNCYLVKDSNGKTIILDVGIKFKDITAHKDFPSFKDIEFVFSGHIHRDHSLALNDFKVAGCEIISYEALKPEVQKFYFEDFDVITFMIKHNVKNWGIVIHSKTDNEKLCYVSDFYEMPTIEGVDKYVYEVNYIDALIDEMIDNDKELTHTGFKFHNSLENAVEYFSKLKKKPKSILVCHTSNHHAIREEILKQLQPFADVVRIAKRDE